MPPLTVAERDIISVLRKHLQSLNEQENQLIEAFRSLTRENRHKLLLIAESFEIDESEDETALD